MTSRYDFVLGRARSLASAFLDALPNRPIVPDTTRQKLWDRMYVPLPLDPSDDGTVLEKLVQLVEPALVASGGPRYFGYVTGGALPIAIAADWLAAAWNQNVGRYAQSPALSVLEDVTAQWVRELLEWPQTASVGFTTGCHLANMTALAAARNALFKQIGWDFEEYGFQAASRINVYVPQDVHPSIISALRMLGMGADRVMRIACDYHGRMSVEALVARMKENIGPVLIVAQAGSDTTGAVDDLERLAMLAMDTKSWLHIDGAYGLWAMTSPIRRRELRGAQLANSWALDAHTWLNVPYDCGIVGINDSAAHRAAMSPNAAFVTRTEREERNGMEWAPEWSRRARVVPLYAAIHSLGKSGIGGMIDRCCDLALEMSDYFREADGCALLNRVVFNQLLVAFEPPPGRSADDWNREVIRRVQEDGTCWVNGTTFRGQHVMHISICNWTTTEHDVNLSAAAILRCAGLAVPQF